MRRHRRDAAYLRWVLRSVASSATLALALLGLSPQSAFANGTLFEQVTGAANPLAGQDIGKHSTLSVGDLDADGDLDLIAGEKYGTFFFFRNSGTAIAPAFVEQTGASNPLLGQDVGFYSTPALADLDGDGDLDLVSGSFGGGFSYFANTGSAANPAFVLRTGAANPFTGQSVGFYTAPTLADLDGDGDLDLVAGNSAGVFAYSENTGSATNPVFVARTGPANPLPGPIVTSLLKPTLGDFDGDGDLDLVAGEASGVFTYFENAGSGTFPVFVLRPGEANPLAGQDFGFSASSSAGDLDDDGDLDLVVGEYGGGFFYDRNLAGAGITKTGGANPLGFADVGSYSTPGLADLDGDGDLDLVAGTSNGTFSYFVNTGSATLPAYVERTGSANPLTDQDVGSHAAPALGDLDGDGDFDLVVGNLDGLFVFFANTGSRTVPAFVQRTGASNPFASMVVGGFSAAGLVDLDADGDLDLVSAGYGSGASFYYFENTGTATSPAFIERTGAGNPLAGFSLPSALRRTTLGDLDGDGDFDLIVSHGHRAGGNGLFYAENVGTATTPVFANRTGTSNPLAGVTVGSLPAPALGDLDGDGDLDLVLGQGIGQFLFAENAIVEPALSAYEGTATGLLKNPLAGLGVGSGAAPSQGDLDGDGDLDLIVGASNGTFRFFANTRSAVRPAYVERTGAANPLAGQDVGFASTPAFGDLDGDGDLDLVAGEANGTLRYFGNFGSATLPAFIVVTGPANRFAGLVSGYNPAPALGDLDGDGDLDLVVGDYDGVFFYFENTGSATTPAFLARTGASNPLGGQDVGLSSIPALADLDEDGDLDLVSGTGAGSFAFFENTGTAKLPSFVLRTGAANPLTDRVVVGGAASAPTLGDIDHDGDPDVIAGGVLGGFSTYYVPEPLRGLILGAGLALLRGLGRMRRTREARPSVRRD